MFATFCRKFVETRFARPGLLKGFFKGLIYCHNQIYLLKASTFDRVFSGHLQSLDNLELVAVKKTTDLLYTLALALQGFFEWYPQVFVRIDTAGFIQALRKWARRIQCRPPADSSDNTLKLTLALLEALENSKSQLQKQYDGLAKQRAAITAKQPPQFDHNADFGWKYTPFEAGAPDVGKPDIFFEQSDLERQVSLNPLTARAQFRSDAEYLDTHYRLLREDFAHVVRAGLRFYRRQTRNGNPMENPHGDLYRSVRIVE